MPMGPHDPPPGREALAARAPVPAPLLLDLYELTMAQSYFNEGMAAPATFSLFVRHLPPGWGYFVAAGLDDVLAYLETFAFREADLAYLESTRLFTTAFLTHLRGVRFTGTVRALPEGTVCFPDEPLLEVTAPIMEAQLVETAILNQIHLQTLIASKAARCVAVAEGRRLVDFGLRRTHGIDAGIKVARSAYLAGFDATSNVLAGQLYGIPIAGTMAHSYIQAFPNELDAFRAFARTYPDTCVLLVDTYDSIEGTRRAAQIGRELAAAGHRLRGVRLDSGDLIGLSFVARQILDEAGLTDAIVFASGNVDEYFIAKVVAAGAPIAAFGVGTRLGVSADAPYLDMAYKLVAYADRPVLKLSTDKATWPGPKEIWRRYVDGTIVEDCIARADEPVPSDSTPLLVTAMQDGRRLYADSLVTARERARRETGALPATCRRLDAPGGIPVRFSPGLARLRDQVAAHAGHVLAPER